MNDWVGWVARASWIGSARVWCGALCALRVCLALIAASMGVFEKRRGMCSRGDASSCDWGSYTYPGGDARFARGAVRWVAGVGAGAGTSTYAGALRAFVPSCPASWAAGRSVSTHVLRLAPLNAFAPIVRVDLGCALWLDRPCGQGCTGRGGADPLGGCAWCGCGAHRQLLTHIACGHAHAHVAAMPHAAHCTLRPYQPASHTSFCSVLFLFFSSLLFVISSSSFFRLLRSLRDLPRDIYPSRHLVRAHYNFISYYSHLSDLR